MNLKEFNSLSEYGAKLELFKCCGSTSWTNQLVAKMPFSSLSELIEESDKIWENCVESDYLEAFTHHPKIGDISSLEKRFSSTQQWAAGEQASVEKANQSTLQQLAKGNELYETKFGFIFIVCATGKGADEMLNLLNQRLPNNRSNEIKIAATEQNKITHIRISKLFS